jgi:hypothetical protein
MSSTPISCVTLGKHRHHAEAIASQLPLDYSVVAILDEQSYSPANLGVISRVLRPRPRALLIGGGFSDEEVEGGIKAWEEYVKEVGVEGTAVIRVPVGTLQKIGEGRVADWVSGELKRNFG